MLRILMGRANTGKSARILEEIRKNRSGRCCWPRNTPATRRSWIYAGPAAAQPVNTPRFSAPGCWQAACCLSPGDLRTGRWTPAANCF